VDIRTNVVQKKDFHLESVRKKYLVRWEVIYFNVFSGINNSSNYLASKNKCMCLNAVKLNKKRVKCTLIQTLRLCTGHTAHRGSGGIVLLFLDHGTRRG